jgi:small subunit ribosomal protein S21
MSTLLPDFKAGDLVRVRAARRRDVVFTVREVTATVVVAANDRGGEARYPAESFELVERPGAAIPSSSLRSIPPRVDEHSDSPAMSEYPDGATVQALPAEEIDSLLRRFKKCVQKSGISAELRRHEFFESRSVRRRKKALRARIRRGELSKAA